MHISVSLLFLFIGSTSGKKEGDFGIFTACTKNNSLRLDCYYANCTGSPSYNCEFKTSNGTTLEEASYKECKITLPDHRLKYRNVITTYTCILTRKERKEERNITIDYSIRKGKHHIKPCPAAIGLLLYQTPALLWPVVAVSLWRVLVTDRQPT